MKNQTIGLENAATAELNDEQQRVYISEYGEHVCNLSYGEIVILYNSTIKSYKKRNVDRVMTFFHKILSK